MAHITASKVRQDLSDTLNRVAYGRRRVVFERRGKAIAAVIPIEDLRLLEVLEDRIDLADARAALAEAKKKGTKSLETIVKELGL
jgi:prevent-host-death family protein